METLENSHHESRAALATLDQAQGVAWFSPDGTILAANRLFCEMFGYRADEIIGQHYRIFLTPAEAASPEYEAYWRKLASGGQKIGEFTRRAKDGREVFINASHSAIRDDNGAVTKIVMFATDVTERAIIWAKDRAQIDAISRSQAVIEFLPDGTIVTANENFLKSMGYRLDEVQGKHHRMFVEQDHAASREYSEFWRKLAQGQFLSSEFKRKTKQGHTVWIQATYNPIFDLADRVVSVVKYATDITDKKRQTDRLVEGVDETSSAIAREAQAIADKSNELSKRSETQAATVEQTSAAMEEMSATVASNARHAEDANGQARAAREAAEKGGMVVQDAIEAMTRIEAGSKEIRSFIEVIDSIAFQTNLLALNAGVEAARAGDAGRGFAVVASEVRALAQRASESAKDINALIDKSGREVTEGARLVKDAGTALSDILEGVRKVSEGVDSIHAASREQAEGIEEINAAISTIDKDTQRNALMSQESAEAAANLAQNSTELLDVVDKFRRKSGRRETQTEPTGERRPLAPKLAASVARPKARPRFNAPPIERKVAVNETPAFDDDDWTEF